MTRAMLIVFATLTVSAVRAEDAAEEVKRLQGEWQAVEVESKGVKLGKGQADVKRMRVVFKGDGFTVPGRPEEDGAERKKSFRLNPAKSPKEIDITSLDGPEKNTTSACIYKLEKDRLTICMPVSSKGISERPKAFKAGADDGNTLVTFERVPAK